MSGSPFARRYSKPFTPENESETDRTNAYIKMARQGGHFAPEWMTQGESGERAGGILRQALLERPIQHQVQQDSDYHQRKPSPTYRDWVGCDGFRGGGWTGSGSQRAITEAEKYTQSQRAQGTDHYGQYGHEAWYGQEQQRQMYYLQQAYHQPLSPTAPQGWHYQQPHYYGHQQQVYVSIQSQPSRKPHPWQIHKHVQEQSWLTPHFQAHDDVSPPVPPSEDAPPPPPPPESPLNPSAPAFSPQQTLRHGRGHDRANHLHPVIPSKGPDQPGVARSRLERQIDMSKAVRMPGLTAKTRKSLPKTSKNPAASSRHQTDPALFHPTRQTLPFRTPPLLPSTARLNLLPRPEPTAAYLWKVNRTSNSLAEPRKLLVILDLNGTLLHRINKGSVFTERPRVREFLHYLLWNHKIMIWSSARAHNVQAMVDKLFSPKDKEYLVAVWTRDHLHLTQEQFHSKVQVYKQLSWVWKDADIQALYPNGLDRWSQENTVLIDDSVEKAASEPYNIVRIDEFEGKEEQMKTEVLGQVVRYLEGLSFKENVSALMKERPFVYDTEAEGYDWMSVIDDMH